MKKNSNIFWEPSNICQSTMTILPPKQIKLETVTDEKQKMDLDGRKHVGFRKPIAKNHGNTLSGI